MFDPQIWWALLQGAWVGAQVAFISILIGIPLGLLVAIIRVARIPLIDQFLIAYISVIRTTPVVTLILFIFLSIQGLGINLGREATVITALVINTTAFNAEIWRASISSFSKDQREAAMAVGMTTPVFFRQIMLPQIVTTSLPGLVNEATMIVKGTPAIAIIGLVDLTQATRRIAVVTYDPLPPMLMAALIYICLVSILTSIQAVLERKAKRLAT